MTPAFCYDSFSSWVSHYSCVLFWIFCGFKGIWTNSNLSSWHLQSWM